MEESYRCIDTLKFDVDVENVYEPHTLLFEGPLKPHWCPGGLDMSGYVEGYTYYSGPYYNIKYVWYPNGLCIDYVRVNGSEVPFEDTLDAQKAIVKFLQYYWEKNNITEPLNPDKICWQNYGCIGWYPYEAWDKEVAFEVAKKKFMKRLTSVV